jgi:hypothetical protein
MFQICLNSYNLRYYLYFLAPSEYPFDRWIKGLNFGVYHLSKDNVRFKCKDIGTEKGRLI